MSLERAIDDQRLMDQVYASAGPLQRTHARRARRDASCSERSLRRHHHRHRRRRRDDGAGAGRSDRRGSRARARRARAPGARELESGSGLETSAYRTTERWLDAAGREFLPVHALRRRRQHEVLGQRAVPAPAGGLRGRRARSTASRQRGRSTTIRWRPSTTAPNVSTTCTGGTASIPPSPHAGRFPIPRSRTRHRCRPSSRRFRTQGLHPSPLPLGLIRPGEPGGCVLCNTCNSFPCRIHAKSDAEVCGVAPALEHSNVELWTNAHARRLIDRSDGQPRRVYRSRARRHDATDRRLALRRVVRRGQLGRAAASLGEHRPSSWARELVRAGGQALHGPSRDDVGGLPSVPEERHGLSEDGGHQRLLFSGAAHEVPARPHPVAGTNARRHGADRGTVDAVVGLRGLGLARRRLARDVRRPAARTTTA